MPAAQLFTAGLEGAINHLLSLDDGAAKNLVPLSGKQLKVSLRELPRPLLFAFSDRVDVLVAYNEDVKADCSLSLSLSTLQILQDPSQITNLIRQNKLDLQGDIHVAQDFSALIKQLDIDWEEHLSRYTGDVFAHTVFSTGRRLFETIRSKSDAILSTLSEGAVEEKQLAAHPIAVEHFCLEVNTLRSDADRFEARLAELERQLERSNQRSEDENHSN